MATIAVVFAGGIFASFRVDSATSPESTLVVHSADFEKKLREQDASDAFRFALEDRLEFGVFSAASLRSDSPVVAHVAESTPGKQRKIALTEMHFRELDANDSFIRTTRLDHEYEDVLLPRAVLIAKAPSRTPGPVIKPLPFASRGNLAGSAGGAEKASGSRYKPGSEIHRLPAMRANRAARPRARALREIRSIAAISNYHSIRQGYIRRIFT